MKISKPKKYYLPGHASEIEIQVGVRRLRAVWTPEMAQDLTSYHAFDAERELIALVNEEWCREIARQMIRDLMKMTYENQ